MARVDEVREGGVAREVLGVGVTPEGGVVREDGGARGGGRVHGIGVAPEGGVVAPETRAAAFATPWRGLAGRRVRAGQRPAAVVAGNRVRGVS